MRATRWAWAQAVESTQKLVLLAIADVANEQGDCCPSVGALAKRCKKSPRTIQRALQALIAADLVSCDSRHRPNGSAISNRYVLKMGARSDRYELSQGS